MACAPNEARTARGPGPKTGASALERLLAEVAELGALERVRVTGRVLVDGDVRLLRVTIRREADRTRQTVVVDVLACGDQLGAVREGRALRAALRDRLQVVLQRGPVDLATLQGGQSQQHDGVVRLRRVAVRGQLLVARRRHELVELRLEGTGDVDTRVGELRA